jgi:hypothetical protein
MNAMEPPPLAAWMLEHLAPEDRDEALTGNLLEVFRSGRSRRWFWRQVLAACAVAWFRSLRSRVPLVTFALLWSMLAPVWTALAERIDVGPRFQEILRMHWPLTVALWMGIDTAFLWSGMLVFIAARPAFRRALRRQSVVRAFLLAPTIFLPAYAATFALTNLFWYPGLGGPLVLAPLTEIVDISVPANALRIPYLVALLVAFWRVVPQRLGVIKSQRGEPAPLECTAQSGALKAAPELDRFLVIRFFTLAAAAGLVNAIIASFLLCRSPEDPVSSLTALGLRAALYVVIGALAGMGGTWFYWRCLARPFHASPPLPFSLFALVCASAWVWVPCMILFHEQLSAVSALAALAGALLFASGLHSATRAVFAPASQVPSIWEFKNAGLFANLLHRPSFDVRGYAIAIALYAAGWALTTHSNYTAAMLLAFAAFLFAWERTAPSDYAFDVRREFGRSARRLACVLLPAVLLTMWALIDAAAHRNLALAAQGANSSPSARDAQHQNHNHGVDLSGYQSIILWPAPPKKQILPPLPEEDGLTAKGTRRPLILRFDGAYWYFQPPDTRPGPEAHQDHGTPLAASIRSNNSFPLLAEAHQRLVNPIPLSPYGEIQVEIEDRLNLRSPVEIALLLTDSSTQNKPTLYLGQQPLLTSGTGGTASLSSIRTETLRFSIPKHGSPGKFDTITFMFLPENGYFFTAPKIAIDQFSLIPR